MAETVIELDLSTPWEPPAPRRRLRIRTIALLTVLAVTLGVLVAGGPVSRAGLLYTLDVQVLQADSAGGRLYLARYQGTGPGPVIEARRLSDGALLWEHSTDIQQQLLVLAGGDVVILLSEDQTGQDGASSTLTAFDAATGRQLWTRSGVTLTGSTPGIVIVQDATADLVDIIITDTEYKSGINYASPRPERRIHGLSTRTGSVVWDVTIPTGTQANFSWDHARDGRLSRFEALSRTGLLTRWDPRTGRTTETNQLDWSGVPARFDAGRVDGTGRPADRVIVYPDKQRGAVVFDLATGRSLFNWPGDANRNLFPCATGLFCTGTDAGLDAVDTTTGARKWHVDRYNSVFELGGDHLLVGSYGDPGNPGRPGPAAIVDAATGAVVREFSGWNFFTSGDRPLVWRSTDPRSAVLGELDLVTGLITVFAEAENWYGNPECSTDGDLLACVIVGGLSVWRLPHRR